MAPVVAGVACWTVTMTIQAALTRRERMRITRQFKARASGQLVEHLVTHPDELSVSGEEREVAVVFADLANFTSISEALGGELSVATLKLDPSLKKELEERIAGVDLWEQRFVEHSVSLMERYGKPVVGVTLAEDPKIHTINEVEGSPYNGVYFPSPERAVKAITHMCRYGERQRKQ